MGAVRSAIMTIPTLIGAAGLALCAGLLTFNLAIREIAYGHEVQLDRFAAFGPLSGVTETVRKLRLTPRSFIDGSFQTSYALLIGPRMPLFNFAVRLRNQVIYTLFSTSMTPSIVVGKNSQLVERVYIDDYCTRDVAAFLPGARIWARQIRAMQDVVEAQGKTFLYVVTPSKLAQYPNFLPSGITCPAPVADRVGLVPAWFRLLRAAGVHAVDLTSTLFEAHGRYPFLLYPVGGTHWNAVGGALAGQAVAAALSELRTDGTFKSVDPQWTGMTTPIGVDVDLQKLLNLLWLPRQQPVPGDVTQAAPAAARCRPEDIVIVGGSFGHAIGESLSLQPCRPLVREYEYWQVFGLTWTDGVITYSTIDPAERDEELRRARTVIYEDNEQMLGRSRHGKALFDFLIQEPR